MFRYIFSYNIRLCIFDVGKPFNFPKHKEIGSMLFSMHTDHMKMDIHLSMHEVQLPQGTPPPLGSLISWKASFPGKTRSQESPGC